MKRRTKALLSDIHSLFRKGKTKLLELEKHLGLDLAKIEAGYSGYRRKLLGKNIFSELTVREKDVLRAIALGARNKEIAAKLNISEKTVKNHLGNIFQKLQVRSRTQAALLVLSRKDH